jgi:hypothetical protein
VSEAAQNTVENTGRRNLRPPWRKGQSGNPGGRPKKITTAHDALAGRTLPEAIRNQLKALGFTGKTWAQAYAFGAGVQAIKGDIPALKEITDRVEGKVAQPITGADGTPLIPERASLADEAARLLELVAGRAK